MATPLKSRFVRTVSILIVTCASGSAVTAQAEAQIDPREWAGTRNVLNRPHGFSAEPSGGQSPAPPGFGPAPFRWTELGEQAARHTFASAFDASGQRFVVFGGSDGVDYLSDLAMFDLSTQTWLPLSPAAGPSPRRLTEGIYDPVANRMVMFGGYDDEVLNELWALSLGGTPQWTQLPIAGPSPSARGGHTMVYDPVGHRAIVFGGWDGVSQPSLRTNDVWALDLTNPAWTQLTPSGTPPSPRSSAAAVYDPVNHRMLVVGGTDPAYLGDVWSLSLSGVGAWSELNPVGLEFIPREEHSAVFDPERERILIFGGYEQPWSPLGDVWELRLQGAAVWRRLMTHADSPVALWGQGATWDVAGGRMIVHGGLASDASPTTWAYTDHRESDLYGGPAEQMLPGEEDGRSNALRVISTWFAGHHLTAVVEAAGPGDLRLEVFDVSGRRVGRSVVPVSASGRREVSMRIAGLGPGVYLVHALDGSVRASRKVVRLR